MGVKEMSFWIYKKDKSGKKILWQIDFDILSILTLLGLLSALLGPSLFGNPSIILSLPFACSAAGLLLLIIAKLSLYRRGIWFSFGPKQMTRTYATLYKAGYILIGLGVLLMLLTWNVLRRA
jgi:hypothetical protein